jgi:adenylate cyclase
MDWLSDIRTWLSDNEAMISAIVGLAVLAGILFTGLRFLLGRRTQTITKTALDEDPLLALPTGPVVAVLPFENLGRDSDQEYFSDGLTDEIITALSRFKNLFVIARNSTFRYKGQAVDVRQLSRELGARYVLEGSVQRAGNAVRVTAQLLDAKDGTHLWAETYDRELSTSNIFEVQDEITAQVAATIGGLGVISRARFDEVRGKPPDRLDAYECVLQFSNYARDRVAPAEHARVRDAIERAVKLDPGYSEAWASLAALYLDEHRFDFNPRPDPLNRALEAAQRAVDLDSTSQTAHGMLAQVHFFRHELDPFLAETDRAIALNPNSAVTLAMLGNLLLNAGHERGIGFVRKAIALDPFHPTWFNIPLTHYHFGRGEYEEALAAARKITIPGYYWIQILLAGVYAALDRQDEARSALEELLKLFPGFTTENLIREWRKWNHPDENIRRWVDALRKAGLPG